MTDKPKKRAIFIIINYLSKSAQAGDAKIFEI
jgi:hypothetical protein